MVATGTGGSAAADIDPKGATGTGAKPESRAGITVGPELPADAGEGPDGCGSGVPIPVGGDGIVTWAIGFQTNENDASSGATGAMAARNGVAGAYCGAQPVGGDAGWRPNVATALTQASSCIVKGTDAEACGVPGGLNEAGATPSGANREGPAAGGADITPAGGGAVARANNPGSRAARSFTATALSRVGGTP
jgi:hypothetical protein